MPEGGFTNYALAGGQGSCVNFANGIAWTREGSTNRLDVSMEIAEIFRGVALPGSLMLLGLGLLGGVARRARRKAA